MISTFSIKSVQDVDISGKRIVVRADFDVSLNKNHTIANDTRIKSNIPTLLFLLEKKCRIICIGKLNRPESRHPDHSLKVVVDALPHYLPGCSFKLIDDFLTEKPEIFEQQQPQEVFVLENIRFYPEEEKNDAQFAEKLAQLGDFFVLDAFAMAHRDEASVTGIPHYIPGLAGLTFEKEVDVISKALKEKRKPFVTIVGGAKISSKISLLEKFIAISDFVLLGGGLANTFLAAQNVNIGRSLCEKDNVQQAADLYALKDTHNTSLQLPVDAVIAEEPESAPSVVDIDNVPESHKILDIGPKTQKIFADIISKAETIIWNGPMGYIEHDHFKEGSDSLCHAITENKHAVSIVGGGETLTAISGKENLDNITHISTGGGAMLELIEKDTLPGITALQKSQKKFF